MKKWRPTFLSSRIEQAALNAELWPDVLGDISEEIGARGAVLVSTEKQMPGVPVSPGVAEMIDDYFRSGWNLRDLRAERAVPILLTRGVATEQDFISQREIRRSPYYQDWVERHGCRHFAGVGVRVAGEFWCVSIQRSVAQGPFEPEELKRLATLCRPLSEAATLSRHLGFHQVLGMAHALELISQAAILLDGAGRILTVNDRATVMLGHSLDAKERTLSLADARSQSAFSALVAHAISQDLEAGPVLSSISIQSRRRQWIRVRAVALRDWARFSFASARALLLFDWAEGSHASAGQGFGLTPAETRLAEELCAGRSLRVAAERQEIAYATARSYLKTIFAKTQTQRQGELVARLLGDKYRN